MPRHFLDLDDLEASQLQAIIDDSIRRKANATAEKPLLGEILAMIFENPSTRTRVSFDVAMRSLGGSTMVLSAGDMQLGRGETIADTARVMSRYVDAIMIRTPDPAKIADLAAHATIPVINGLTRESHPCQVMADVMTLVERRGSIAGATIAWVGAANNVLTSWVQAALAFGFKLTVATPPALAPSIDLIETARRKGADIETYVSADAAVRDADCIVTDTWVSMGDEDADSRRQLLQPFQVNQALLASAKSDTIFMHCLPAHRGEEVTAEVIDGPQSAVWDEAENRLHVQKGILAWCLGGETG